MNLVIGATGVLGTEICRRLREQGKPVRGLVRTTSAPEKKANLEQLGVELVEGDLKDSASLERACRNVQNVISSATSIVTAQPGDTFERTDQDGHLSLIEAAEKSGVERFVFISFPPMLLDFPLQAAKRAVEERLKNGRLSYVVLQPTLFQEVWLGPHLGFDAINGQVRIYGTGKQKISYISFKDVAEFVTRSLENRSIENQIIALGGPESLSPLDVVKLFEEITGRNFKVEYVPEDALKAQYESAKNPVEKTFSGLILGSTQDFAIDMQSVLKFMPVQLHSVRDYAMNFA